MVFHTGRYDAVVQRSCFTPPRRPRYHWPGEKRCALPRDGSSIVKNTKSTKNCFSCFI